MFKDRAHVKTLDRVRFFSIGYWEKLVYAPIPPIHSVDG